MTNKIRLAGRNHNPVVTSVYIVFAGFPSLMCGARMGVNLLILLSGLAVSLPVQGDARVMQTSGGLPRKGAVLLEFNAGAGEPGKKDLKDIYGPALSSKGRVVFGASQLGLGYVLTTHLQIGVLYGLVGKEWEVAVGGDSVEKWEFNAQELAARLRYLIEIGDNTNLSLGGGFGKYKLWDSKYTHTDLTGQLELTGSGTGSWGEIGLEWFWSTFAFGISGGYRSLVIRPVKMEGKLNDTIIAKQSLITLTGKDPHLDFSGPQGNLALRWYFGGSW